MMWGFLGLNINLTFQDSYPNYPRSDDHLATTDPSPRGGPTTIINQDCSLWNYRGAGGKDFLNFKGTDSY